MLILYFFLSRSMFRHTFAEFEATPTGKPVLSTCNKSDYRNCNVKCRTITNVHTDGKFDVFLIGSEKQSDSFYGRQSRSVMVVEILT